MKMLVLNMTDEYILEIIKAIYMFKQLRPYYATNREEAWGRSKANKRPFSVPGLTLCQITSFYLQCLLFLSLILRLR